MLKKLLLSLSLIQTGFLMYANPIHATENQQVLIEEKKLLAEKAAEARQRAYAPYSNFFVGAAIMTHDGKIYQGCNVENASYGLAICAERTAAVKAASDGVRSFKAIAVSVPGGGTPCGACRQFLNEFNPDLP